MKTEYSERGFFHAVHNSKLHNINKNVLRAETTALFVKDKMTNRLVGKEFHIVNERKLDNGKIKTKKRVVRVNAPLYKQRGLLHHIVNEDRRIEGDTFTVRHSVTKKLDSIKPSTKKGNYALGVAKNLNSTRKFVQSGTLKTALATETFAIKVSDIGVNKLRNKAVTELDSSDSGKAVLSAITAVSTANSARKAIIRHRIQNDRYKVLKKEYKFKKQLYKQQKSEFETKKDEYLPKAYRYRVRNKQISKIYGKNKDISDKKKYKFRKKQVKKIVKKYPKKQLKLAKKNYKFAKKSKKFAKGEMKRAKAKSLLRVFGEYEKNVTKQKFYKELDKHTQDNDAYKAVKASKNATKKVIKTVNNGSKKVDDLKHSVQRNKLHTKENKLREQKSKLGNKKKITKNKAKKSYKKQTKQQIMLKAKKEIVETISAFTKFSFKFLGVMTVPVIVMLLIFAVLISMLGGITGNSSFILGTYNASDIDIEKVISSYTEIAYDFNQNVMRTQKSSTFQSALHILGATETFDDTPDEFIFGKNMYQNYDSNYDFDPDKLIAFMSAYYYDVTSDNDDIELWTCSSDYESILQKLFDEEYEFEYEYVNGSHWVGLGYMEIYPSADTYWYVDSSGIEMISHKKYGYMKWNGSAPSELQEFVKNKKVYFDLTTGEVKNPNKSYGKTGYYIQNLNYQYTLGSSVLKSFYYVSGSNFFFNIGDTQYPKTQLYVGSDKFNYAIAKEDVSIFTGENKEKQLMRDYRQEKYIKECKLYCNVKQKKTFDEAIKALLQSKGNYDERIAFYNTLTDGETFGNHQVFRSPFTTNYQTIINNKWILNYYGYDMQEWNKNHCNDLIDCHYGIDFIANTGTNVLAMYDGKITKIDNSKHTITITADVDYWYLKSDGDNIMKTEITYTNITPIATLNVGDTVKNNDLIGVVDNYKHCKGNGVNNYGYDFLEISINIKKDFILSYTADPYFLIYRE